MPIYEYVCQDCSTKYDKLVRSLKTKIELKCPQCGSHHGEKALSAFSTCNVGGVSFGNTTAGAPACGPVG